MGRLVCIYIPIAAGNQVGFERCGANLRENSFSIFRRSCIVPRSTNDAELLLWCWGLELGQNHIPLIFTVLSVILNSHCSKPSETVAKYKVCRRTYENYELATAICLRFLRLGSQFGEIFEENFKTVVSCNSFII